MPGDRPASGRCALGVVVTLQHEVYSEPIEQLDPCLADFRILPGRFEV